MPKVAPTRARAKRSAAGTPAVPRWQVVENVVAAIERVRAEIPGIIVTQRAQLPRLLDASATRDVDVLVELPVGGRVLRIAIEVKGRTRPLSIDQMGALVELWRDVAVDRFCVGSTSGFTAGARNKAAENGVELASLEEFQQSAFWAGPPGFWHIESGGEFLHTAFEFAPGTSPAVLDALHQAMAGATFDNVTVHDATGRATLRDFLSASIREAFKGNQAAEQDGQIVSLRVEVGSRKEFRLTANGADFHSLSAITTTARIKRTLQKIPERRFRSGNIELSTSELTLFGEQRQFSLVAERQPDDTVQMKIVVGPVAPARTNR